MTLRDFLVDVDRDVATILTSDFEIEVIETTSVPDFSDPNITYDNLDTKKKKCKLLESCVLYVDIRESSRISASRRPRTLAKVYSSFIRSMINCSRYFGGHVRNIIGDRVMVVFDQKDCFEKALNTAVLMNTVSQRILNKRISTVDFKCGVGIDYGKMLITKSGTIRQGEEKEFYRSLVWLGRPANVASRLTDLAFKTGSWSIPSVKQGNYYRHIEEWLWMTKSYDQFLDELEPTGSRQLNHKDEHFNTFFKTSPQNRSTKYSPILLTEAVMQGMRKAQPKSDYVRNNWFKKKNINVPDFAGVVFGGDVYFLAADEL